MEYKKHRLNIYPEMQEDEFSRLRTNIFANGYDEKYPIYLFEGEIIDGWNRYRACKALNINPVVKNFEGNSYDAMQLIIRSNDRRDLTSSQRAAIAVEAEQLVAILKEEAKARQIESGKQFGRSIEQEKVVQKIAQPNDAEKNKVRTQLAQTFGTNRQYVSDVAKIKENNPVAFNQILSGEKTISDVKKEIKIENRLLQIEETKEKIKNGIDNSNIENRKYSVITIDPPWNYGEVGGLNSEDYNPQSARGVTTYPTMSIQEIINIKLPAADDCVLFLWTTHAFLPYTFDIAKKWGFEYKATIVWDKEKMGIGRNVRMQVEFCLLCTKGKPILIGSSERDIIRESRREHSRKPEAFYEMVERMCIGNKLDFFSREKRINWETYGAEINKF